MKISSYGITKFGLGDNYIDKVSGRTLYTTIPAPIRKFFLEYPESIPTEIIQTDLVFHMKPSGISGSIWSNNGFNFIPQTMAKYISSIVFKIIIMLWVLVVI